MCAAPGREEINVVLLCKVLDPSVCGLLTTGC